MFLDKIFEAANDNILQENLLYVLTSSEMIALSRVRSIVHFKIVLPMRWLTGSTHIIGILGYDDRQFMTDLFRN